MAVYEEGKKAVNELNGGVMNNRCLIARKAWSLPDWLGQSCYIFYPNFYYG